MQTSEANPFAAYPLYLTAKDISDALQVCLTTAHDIMNDPHCPTLRLGKKGKSKRVHRDRFFEWITESRVG